MLEFKLDSEEKIKKLVNLLDDVKLTNRTQEALKNLNDLSAEDELFIVSMIISLAIKELFQKIIIKI